MLPWRLAPLFSLAVGCADATGPLHEELPEPGPQDAASDQALAFDGVDDYASAGSARMPQIERPQSLMLWVKPAAALPSADAAQEQVLLTLRRSDWSGIVLALDRGIPVAHNVFGPRDLARAEAPLALDQWHHLAYVLEGNASQLYVDGIPATAQPGDPPGTNRTPLHVFIGSLDGYSGMFHGLLDELRVYDRAFDAAEIGAFVVGPPPQAEPLVLHLPFDEAAGARSYDRSGLGNHAQLGDGVPKLMPLRVPAGRP